ncbi:MAG: 50S ribosomal protein L23 [Candidatus Latescibacteria bacterium]|jgi:large subunit ribosomal protein L23|nr:50S ribosomal protein L23 [Gemmatimonadaceae bacterium]MDP7448925.1 50S ribosomal protein L23 [Candidatus Latescibacterota bacterium]HJP30349.1 50S ribosomal protein L23 [Candidatus Latescibacterota bacterium]|tara:strand:- start:1468 stop:1755 length:288 start_codon:yes stop_codon:yes gene_type:complete
MSGSRSILRSPVVTEKATILRDGNTYTFKVDARANKVQIRQAVESIFEVKVDSVRTLTVRPKPKRQGAHQGSTSSWKKAYVKLRSGESIDLIENL